MAIEILAPAGGREQLIAAVRAGADAVYLGTKAFNARRKADNFGDDDLKSAVAYCHGRGVRVHVTVNTLVADSELSALEDTVREIGESGADAVILQDQAAAQLFRSILPDLPRHASTQMTIHNAEGALAARELGFSRVILARELSLAEIRRIREQVDLELECFVHGALCMGVSGQCLLSAVLGERSGNRGMCAQPCRLDFHAEGRPYALSLKDACLVPQLRALQEAGVCSLKIEGRLRRPEYVAAATDACVRALRGETPDLSALEKVFSRSGFTDGYLSGRRGLGMFGIRSEADKAAAGEVLGQLSSLYRRERSRVPVDLALSIHPGEPVRLQATDGVHCVSVLGEAPEPVRTAAPDPRASLEKTGGTPFLLRELRTDVTPGYTAKLNPLRREALDALLAARETIVPYTAADCHVADLLPPARRPDPGAPRLRLRFEDRSQFFDCPEAEAVYLPIEQLDRDLIARCGDRLIGELPRLLFPLQEPAMETRLRQLRELGLTALCAGNPGSVRLAARLGFRVSGGFDLNILNSLSLAQWEALGLQDTLLSCEFRIKDAPALGGSIPRGVLAYGRLPLMLFRCCPMQDARGCGGCDGRRSLTDRQGRRFPVLCHRKQYSTLLNSLPLYIGDKPLRGLDFLTAYFTLERREEAQRIAALLLERAAWPGPGERTNGPYFRPLV